MDASAQGQIQRALTAGITRQQVGDAGVEEWGGVGIEGHIWKSIISRKCNFPAAAHPDYCHLQLLGPLQFKAVFILTDDSHLFRSGDHHTQAAQDDKTSTVAADSMSLNTLLLLRETQVWRDSDNG